jgi:drug/metabolite transporter (DMT)-like permease
MLGSNSLVCWAETRVDSSVAAVVIACVPLWMLVFDWARRGGVRPPAHALAGVALGIGGVALLAAPDPAHPIDPLGILALFGATISWAVGSLYSRSARLPPSPFLSSAMQMLCGGALQIAAGFLLGEGARLELARVGPGHVAAVLWLVVAGSLVGFTAYLWLLKNTTPAVATSYAFVNPLVALALGVLLLDEELSPRAALATAAIVSAVALVVMRRR